MKAKLQAAGQRLLAWPPIAHHWAAFRRADGLRFTRWAAAIALFGYLSLFPLVVLAFVVFGLVLSRYPGVRAEVDSALQDSIPLLFGSDGNESPVDIAAVADATVSAGVVSVVALLIAGLGWVDATVEGTRRMLGALRRPQNFIVLRLQDAGGMLAVGTVLLLALVVSVGVRSAGVWVLGLVGIEVSSGWALRLSADIIVAVLVWLVLASFYGFVWSRPQRRWRPILQASFMAAVILAIATRFAYLIVGRTLDNPVYGALAIAAALLVYLYVASIVHLYFACWVAVAEGAPIPAEQLAYEGRARGGPVTLPKAAEVRGAGDDAASG